MSLVVEWSTLQRLPFALHPHTTSLPISSAFLFPSMTSSCSFVMVFCAMGLHMLHVQVLPTTPNVLPARRAKWVIKKLGERLRLRHPLRAVTPPVQSQHIKRHKKKSQNHNNLDTSTLQKFSLPLLRSHFRPFPFLDSRPLSG